MVRFILDPEGYEKAISTKEATVAAAKTFQFIKGNSAVSKAATNPISQTQNTNPTKKAGTDFSFALKK